VRRASAWSERLEAGRAVEDVEDLGTEGDRAASRLKRFSRGSRGVAASVAGRTLEQVSEAVSETWSWRELPLLRIAVAAADRNRTAELDDIAAELTLEYMQVRIAAQALQDEGYLRLYLPGGMVRGHVAAVSGKARRAVGSWPSAEIVVDELATALEKAAENEVDPERKSKLRSVADALGGVARAAAAGELQAILHRYGGGFLP
jgi:hypothetical protein